MPRMQHGVTSASHFLYCTRLSKITVNDAQNMERKINIVLGVGVYTSEGN